MLWEYYVAGCLQYCRFLGGCGVCLVINTVVKAWHRTSMTHLNTFSGWKGDLPKLCKNFTVVQNMHMVVLKHKTTTWNVYKIEPFKILRSLKQKAHIFYYNASATKIIKSVVLQPTCLLIILRISFGPLLRPPPKKKPGSSGAHLQS